MLYYIVPPIIIVLSLSFLISFLFRKFSVAGQEKVELLEDLNEASEKKEVGLMIQSFFSRFWFKLLEKATQRMKLFSLKMHNASNDWFHSVKNRQDKITLAEKEIEKESQDVLQNGNTQIETMIEQKEEPVLKRRPRIENFSIKQRIVRKRLGTVKREELVAEPEPVIEKNRLEQALIKRIAVNPKDIEAYERLGDYYYDIKNFKDSVECYKQVTKLSPRHFKAKAKLRSLERIMKM